MVLVKFVLQLLFDIRATEKKKDEVKKREQPTLSTVVDILTV